MSYEPLHQKYRPQTFAQLIGQEAIATTLTQAIAQQRIAPAYLFAGERGTGKTSSARILAKSLNCLNSDAPTPTPCGQCESCRAIANGSALDVIEIDAASNNGVEQIRDLIERAQFATIQGRYKVFILDEAHMVTVQGNNALLKILEEPPQGVVFVLATTDPQRLLSTVISRCQRYDFRRIPLEAMVKHLGTIATAEDIDITPEALRLVAQLSQGGLRDAQSSLDQLSLMPAPILPNTVWDMVGAVSDEALCEILELLLQRDREHSYALLHQVQTLFAQGKSATTLLEGLVRLLNLLQIAYTNPDLDQTPTVYPILESTWDRLCGVADGMIDSKLPLQLEDIVRIRSTIRQAASQIGRSPQPQLWAEALLLDLL